MDRLDQLTAQYLDGEITPAEARELSHALTSDPLAAAEFAECYRNHRNLEALHLPAEISAADAILSELRAPDHGFVRGIMGRLEAEPLPDRSIVAPSAWAWIQRLRWPAWGWLAGAAAVLVLAAMLLFPAQGTPVVAAVNGATATVLRDGELLAIRESMPLQAGDRVETDTETSVLIRYGVEPTEIKLEPATRFGFGPKNRSKRFSLDHGKIVAAVARQRPFAPLVVTTPNAETRVLGTRFSLVVNNGSTDLGVEEGRVQITARDGSAVKVGAGESARVAPGVLLSALPTPGRLLHEKWTSGVAGYQVNDLFEDTRFPTRPSVRESVTRLEVIAPPGRDAGGRLAGYIHPPRTGDYVFFIAGSANCIFRLSRDADPGKALQVFDIGGPNDALWSDTPPRRSTPRRLIAGWRYYIECIYRNGSNGGQFAVAWQAPGGEREVIRGEFLSPLETEK